MSCICGVPSFDVLVGCDNDVCSVRWFHLRCVGLTAGSSPQGKWHCPQCRQHGDQYIENEADLQLAAELGKALLERNRELESQNLQLQTLNNDQNLEIEYLTKQLEALRQTSESRMRVFEDIDRNAQEQEKTNQRLMIDSKTDKQRIEKLCSTVENLEDKCDEMEKKIEEMKAAEKKKKQKPDSRRTRSVACLPKYEDCDNMYIGDLCWTYTDQFRNLPLNPYEIEIRKLQEYVKQLKAQQLIDRRKRDDADTEISLLWDENQSLEIKVKQLDAKDEQIRILQEELQKAKFESDKLCGNCGLALESAECRNPLESEVEHDDPILRSAAKLVKLEGGGSAYGSTESLNKVGTDVGVATSDDVDNAGVSILNELEAQYQSLFNKYESMMQGRNVRPGSWPDEEESFDAALHRHLAQGVSHKEVQTLLKLQRREDSEGSEFEAGSPPAYKTIFRDIFATLKKSRIEESGEVNVTSPQVTPATTPSSGEVKSLANGT